MAEKGFIGGIIYNMKEDAKKQHEKDKEVFEKVKAESKARFEKATKLSPDMQEFLDAKGIKEKAKVVVEHAKRNAKQAREEDRKKQKEMLKEDREKMSDLINKDLLKNNN